MLLCVSTYRDSGTLPICSCRRYELLSAEELYVPIDPNPLDVAKVYNGPAKEQRRDDPKECGWTSHALHPRDSVSPVQNGVWLAVVIQEARSAC